MGSPAAHLGRVCIRQATRGLSQFSRSENGTVPLCNPRITPYDAVCIVLGLILLTAAALKGHQLATEPVAETSLFSSRWLLIGVVEFELFFGLWLLSGLYPRRTRQAALVCFSAFACVSFYKALSGEATCGCFGRVPVNPWYTLVLDLAAVAALLCWRAVSDPVNSPRPFAGEESGVRARASLLPLATEGPGVRARLRTRLGWVLGISLAAGIPAALAMGTYQAATLDDSGDIFGESEFVVLKPDTWVGKQFPLLDCIHIEDRLAEGEWTVILYDRTCSDCRKLISRYEHGRATRFAGGGFAQIALVEVRPSGDVTEEYQFARNRGSLDATRRWFVKVPLVVALNGGQVVRFQQPAREEGVDQ